MSQMWNRTLVYLGLREEPEEMYDEMPERFDPQLDPHAEHAAERPRGSRSLVGASAGERNGRGGHPSDEESHATGTLRRAREAGDEERFGGEESNVRPLRTSDPNVRAIHGGAMSARVALVDVARFEDVEAVGSRYRTGQPVLFDVVADDRATGQRVVDFVSGLTYASRGRLMKVGTRSFLLVPDGVRIADDEHDRLRGLGYRVPANDA